MKTLIKIVLYTIALVGLMAFDLFMIMIADDLAHKPATETLGYVLAAAVIIFKIVVVAIVVVRVIRLIKSTNGRNEFKPNN